jgi:ComF family protein
VSLAPRCAACDAPLEQPTRGCVCAACWSLVAPVPGVRWVSDAITAARAGGDFEGVLRDVIHTFKYEGRRSLAAPLARLMRRAAADVLDGADCIVPVPLHAFRYMTRGFNQAADLARHLQLPLVHALWRTRRTSSQSGLTAAGRRRNVRDAFALSPLMSARVRDHSLRGRVVVLVDDVRTTGETLDACARVLIERAGVREVRAVTAAARDLR